MKTKIGNIGEFGLIERVRKTIRTDSSVIRGIGDDCAVVDAGAKGYTLMTCDMIVEGVDFGKGEDPALVGRKALAISLSDIAACGGIPRYALVTLGLPRGFAVAAVDGIYQGMTRLAREFQVNIVGGDISRTPALTIDLSLYGTVEKKNLVLRDGARVGDVIFVTGSFGGSIKGKHLRFIPRVKEARFLVANHKVNAMIDCSDGLVQDLRHIMSGSKTGCVLFESAIPFSKDCRGIDDALYSGEDFELIFTVSRKEGAALMRHARGRFTPVGVVVPEREGLHILTTDGAARGLAVGGYRHF